VSEPITPEFRDTMNALAAGIDDILNGPRPRTGPRVKRAAFVLLTAEFGKYEGGQVNYISNGARDDMVAMLKELLARFEGRHQEGGRA
jgi:hypothetical protein